LVWASITSEVKVLAKRLADSKGITMSEYVRQLLLEDLDRRSLFTDEIKRKISSEVSDHD
jgi:hypothetical protein